MACGQIGFTMVFCALLNIGAMVCLTDGLCTEGNYINGLRNGIWPELNYNGSLKSVTTYVNGISVAVEKY